MENLNKKSQFLDFEEPIIELEAKISALASVNDSENKISLEQEIKNLQKKSLSLKKSIFSHLDDWQIIKLARHPERPHGLDYISLIFDDFQELHGDRAFADDKSIVGGIATIDKKSVMVIAQHKGRTTKKNFSIILE